MSASLLSACKASDSPDLYVFVLFALTTGAPKGEITALQWSQVYLKRRWATFPRTKNGEARGVPLTTTVCALLTTRPRDTTQVFPVDITKAWHTAIARAGIVNFRFHDLRHSCGSATTLFLRSYVTYCAARRRYGQMQGDAQLLRESRPSQIAAPNLILP